MEINNRGWIANRYKKLTVCNSEYCTVLDGYLTHTGKSIALATIKCNKTAKESLDCAWHAFFCLVKQMKRHNDLV